MTKRDGMSRDHVRRRFKLVTAGDLGKNRKGIGADYMDLLFGDRPSQQDPCTPSVYEPLELRVEPIICLTSVVRNDEPGNLFRAKYVQIRAGQREIRSGDGSHDNRHLLRCRKVDHRHARPAHTAMSAFSDGAVAEDVRRSSPLQGCTWHVHEANAGAAGDALTCLAVTRDCAGRSGA